MVTPMPAGRPRIISSPDEMEQLVDAYFADCDASNRPYSVEGIALALGLSGREALDVYQDRTEFFDIVKRAKGRVRDNYVREGIAARNPAMHIFLLKNMGYSDRTDLALSTPNGPLQTDSKIEIVIVSANSTSEKSSS